MNFQFYKDTMAKKVADSELSLLNDFCADVISRMLVFVDEISRLDLSDQEQVAVDSLIQMVRSDNVDWVLAGQILDELTLIEVDDEHTMESEFVDFLCAMDNWRALIKEENSVYAISVAEHMMNLLDYYFVDSVSLDDWLSVTELQDEFQKQVSFLDNAP